MGEDLKAEDIQVGKTYRGKRRIESPWGSNDRTIIWISEERWHVQYDSDTVKDGARYPIIPMEQFLKWAKEEVK